MKVIGVKGTKGKSIISEILLKYLIEQNHKVGYFDGKNLFVKNKYQTAKYEIENYLCFKKEYNLDFLIIEIHVESFLYNMGLELLNYDLIIETDKGLSNYENFRSKGHFEIFREKYEGIRSNTYISDDSIDESLEIIKDELKGLIFKYQNNVYNTTLITELNIINLILVINALEAINTYNYKIFRKIIKKIKFKNKLEVIKYKGKTIVVDSDLMNIDIILKNLSKTISNYNYHIFYEIDSKIFKLEEKYENISLELRKAKQIYFLNDNESADSDLVFFVQNIFESKSVSFKVIEDFKKAIININKKEVIILLTKNKRVI